MYNVNFNEGERFKNMGSPQYTHRELFGFFPITVLEKLLCSYLEHNEETPLVVCVYDKFNKFGEVRLQRLPSCWCHKIKHISSFYNVIIKHIIFYIQPQYCVRVLGFNMLGNIPQGFCFSSSSWYHMYMSEI